MIQVSEPCWTSRITGMLSEVNSVLIGIGIADLRINGVGLDRCSRFRFDLNNAVADCPGLISPRYAMSSSLEKGSMTLIRAWAFSTVTFPVFL